MKIAVSVNFGESEYGRWGDERYNKLKEHGFSYVNYELARTDTPVYSADETEFKHLLEREKELACAAGVQIWQIHGPWRYPPRDSAPEDRAERMDKMKKSIRAAAFLGCRYWVVHPIMPCGLDDLKTGRADETWKLNLEFMRELLITAKEHDVVICFENMPFLDFSLSTPRQILKFVKEINDDNFKICLDTGHVSVFPDLSPADCVRELADEIRVFHVHDNSGKADEHLFPYSGIIHWEDFASALKEIGFDSVVCMETSPSSALPTPQYEERCKMIGVIANYLLNN